MSQSTQPDSYRAIQTRPDTDATPGVEEKRLQVRCSQAGQLFEARLIRAAGAKTNFKVTGFEPVSDTALAEYSPGNSLFTRFVKYLSNWLNRNAPPPTLHNATGGEVVMLGIRDIDWENHTCPVCQSAKPASTGGTYSWIQCGQCGNILCTYNLQPGDFSFECPWCNNRGKLSTTPKTLDTARPQRLSAARPAPKTQGPKALPGSDRPKQLPGPKPS